MHVAAYARYSSDAQREASLDDQLRNCRQYAARQGWPEPIAYTDAAISGARHDRPGYRALLRDAQDRRFDVVLVDDLSRLARDSIESSTAIRHLTFVGVRLVGVSDGVDTARKSHKADVGLRGLMSELYLDDLAEKTHRGLTGRALAGASAGGLPYGYRVARTGQRVIDEAQAAVVRRIYAEYLAGVSPRDIAAGLNRDAIRSPSGHAWGHSAIRGDRKRGLGILVNPIYAGQQVWNRSRWVKHPDTGKRVRKERPRAEWIITEHPELRIVDARTFRAAQARMETRGFAVQRRGRPCRHLLSGILRCPSCGGAMVAVDRYAYGCMVHRERGTCMSRLRISMRAAEDALLASIKDELLTDAAFDRFRQRIGAELKRAAPDDAALRRRLDAAKAAHAHIMAALRAGIITPSTRAELIATETEVADAQRALDDARAWKPAALIPRLRERWETLVRTLTQQARNAAVRDALRALIGDAVPLKNDNGAITAVITPTSLIEVVAGAGFEPATFGL